MARFTRFMLGGLFGAALGLLFAPKAGKELRQMLMAGHRRALPPPPEPGPPPVDLESRIEKTREQVEAELEKAVPSTPAAAIEAEAAVEEARGEAAPIAEPEPATETAVEEAEEEEAEEEKAEEEGKAEAAHEPEAEVAEEKHPEPETETAVEEAEEEAAAGEALAEEEDEFAALKTPAAGEPRSAEAAAGPGDAETGPEPSYIDPDEMRRRIEETRARLKAKAFDSMVDGETMIGKGEEIQPAETGPEDPRDIDSEIEDRIDKLLEEEG